VPAPLRGRALYDELQGRRAGLAGPADAVYFGDQPALQIFAGPAGDDPPPSVPPEQVGICDLSTWRVPPAPLLVSVDPARGRLAFRPGEVPPRVEVSFAYGAAGDVGGGPYD